MKYIKTIRQDTGEIEIFLFCRKIHHDAFLETASSIKNQTHGNWQRIFRTAVSAGFVSSELVCYGNSESLKLVSAPEDTEILKQHLFRL